MALDIYTPPFDRIVHETEVDFVTRDNYGRTVYLVQTIDDKLPIIAVSLYQNGVPYVVPENANGNIRWKKPDPDRHYVYDPLLGVNATRTVAYVDVTKQMVVTPGRPKAIIELDVAGAVSGSEPIPIIIDKNPISQSDLESTDEMKTLQEYVDEAQEFKEAAENAQTAAAASASNAKASENAAKTSQTAAAASASNAKASENAAKTSQTAAENAQTAAAASASDATESASSANTYAQQSKSYAIGGTTTRPNEAVDNAKYYYEQTKQISQGLEGVLIPMGTIAFAKLSTASKSAGYMYNISDAFTTNATFKEGSGHAYPAGTNVYYTGDGYWDCLAGYQVVSVNGQTGAVSVKRIFSSGSGDYENSSASLLDDANNTGFRVYNIEGSDVFDDFRWYVSKTDGHPWLRVYKNRTATDNLGAQRIYTSAFPPPYPVKSVAGKTGAVTLAKTDVGLSNVDNTSDASKNVATAKKLATPRTISISGDSVGEANFDGSQNITINTIRRGCIVGQSSNTAGSNTWYKFASLSTDLKSTDLDITFYVNHGMRHNKMEEYGILTANVRTNNDGSFSSAKLSWDLAGASIDTDSFLIAYSTTSPYVCELWVNCNASWMEYRFDVISEGCTPFRNSGYWTLYDNRSASGQAAPTSGYTRVTSTIASIGNSTTGTADTAQYLASHVIANNTDLNTITTPGFYHNGANENVATFKNCPTTKAFSMIVTTHAGTSQLIIEYMSATHKIYQRNYYSSTGWGEWIRVYTTVDKPTASDVSAVPTTRKVNNKALSADISLTASDVGALPLAGGTLMGNLTLSGAARYINYNSGTRNAQAIRFYAGDKNGSGLVIGEGGRTIIGGGESAANLHTALGTETAKEGNEEMHIASDGNVWIHTNCQTIADRKTVTIDYNGNIILPNTSAFVGMLAGVATSSEFALSVNGSIGAFTPSDIRSGRSRFAMMMGFNGTDAASIGYCDCLLMDTYETDADEANMVTGLAITKSSSPEAYIASGQKKATTWTASAKIITDKNISQYLTKSVANTERSIIPAPTVRKFNVNGLLLNSKDELGIVGYGHASITLFQNPNFAMIDFTVKITKASNHAGRTEWGISRDAIANCIHLEDEEQSMPTLIPIDGGSLTAFRPDGTLDMDFSSYGAYATADDQYWVPTRMVEYDSASVLEDNSLPVGSLLTGVLYASYS